MTTRHAPLSLAVMLWCAALFMESAGAQEVPAHQRPENAAIMKQSLAALCAPFASDEAHLSQCHTMCETGWPIADRCALYREFGPPLFPLYQAHVEEQDAVELEKAALAQKWRPEEARRLRHHVSTILSWKDEELLPTEPFKEAERTRITREFLADDQRATMTYVYSDKARYTKYLPTYEVMIQVAEQELGDQSVTLMRLLQKAALTDFAAGNVRQARARYERAAKIAGARLPADHPLRLEIEGYMLAMRCFEHEFALSDNLLELERRAFELGERLGHEHPHALRLARLYGRALLGAGEHVRARPILERALLAHSRLQGDLHDEPSYAAIDLAEALAEGGEYTLASVLLTMAEAVLSKYYDAGTPGMVPLYLAQGGEKMRRARMFGTYDALASEVKTSLRNASLVLVSLHGEDSAAMLEVNAQLGELYRMERDVKQAHAHTNRALKNASALFTPTHPLTQFYMLGMARLLDYGSNAAHPEVARTAYEMVKIIEQVFSACCREQDDLMHTLELKSKILEGRGERDEALAASDQALEMHRKKLGRLIGAQANSVQLGFQMFKAYDTIHRRMRLSRTPEEQLATLLAWQGFGLKLARRNAAQGHDIAALSGKDRAVVTQWEELGRGERYLDRTARAALEAQVAKLGLITQSTIPAAPSVAQLCEVLKARQHHLVNYYTLVTLTRSVYIAVVVSPDCKVSTHELSESGVTNAAVATWRETITQAQACYGKRGDALGCIDAMQRVDDQAASLHARLWAPLEARLEGAKGVYVVPDWELVKFSFEALKPAAPGAKYLVESYQIESVPYASALVKEEEKTRAPKKKRGKLKTLVMGDLTYSAPAPDPLRALGAWSRCAKKECEKALSEMLDAAALERQVASLRGGSGGVKSCGRGVSWAPLRTEAQAVAEILSVDRSKEVSLVTGVNAEEALVMEAMDQSQIIHIATHGFFATEATCYGKLAETLTSNDDLFEKVTGGNMTLDLGMGAAIALTGASLQSDAPQRHDGLLDGSELRQLDLRDAELVVLSACETGVGVAFPGDGVHALNRALLEAGARQTITSLWQVPSQPTSDLFIDMYDTLQRPKGALPAEQALRQAKLRAIARARALGLESSSFLWAAFVMTQSG